MVNLYRIVRGLLISPGYSLTVVVMLALGIGATIAVFSVINGVLIKPLPYRDSDELVALLHRSTIDGANLAASTSTYFTYIDHNRTFESIALWISTDATVTGTGNTEDIEALKTTHEFLSTLGVDLAHGRAFLADDDKIGSPKTAIISHGYWQRRFAGSRGILNESITVDGEPHTIIGILPQTFMFPGETAELILPMQPIRALAYAGPRGENGIARLKKGATLADANRDIKRMLPILYESFPPPPGISSEVVNASNIVPNLTTLKRHIVGDLDAALWILMGTVALLLAIACANVANLQLARNELRSVELATRFALGGSWRVVAGGILTEGTILSLVGGLIGLLLASLGLPIFLAMAADHLPSTQKIGIDFNIVIVTASLSMAVGLIFGLVPALKYRRQNVGVILLSSGRSQGISKEGNWIRSSLMVTQVALATVLLVGAGLLIRTADSFRKIDPGFIDPETIQTVGFSIPESTISALDLVVLTQNEIQRTISEIPGVTSAAFVSTLPLRDGPDAGFFVEGRSGGVESEFRFVSPEYFQTMGTPLIAGRAFEWSDILQSNRKVTIVSENLAMAVWGSANAALGNRIRASERADWQEIIGVVGNVRHEGLTKPAPRTWYRPPNDEMAQWLGRSVTYVARSDRAGTVPFLERIQDAIWSINGNLPLASAQTLEHVRDSGFALLSLTLLLFSLTATIALVVGVVGIFGVVGYLLAERTREIGIRMALGAQADALMWMFMRRTILLVLLGMTLGLAGAAVFGRLLESLLFGVPALDPSTYVVASLILLCTAIVASYLPVRRITRVSPAIALGTN